MNISYNWLREPIAIDLPADELAEKLTRVGLAVEGIHPHGDDFLLKFHLIRTSSIFGKCVKVED